MAIVRDLSGNIPNNASTVDEHYAGGNDTTSYKLVANQTVNTSFISTPVSGIAGGSYLVNTVGTFSGGSAFVIEARNSDSVTPGWDTVATITAAGTTSLVVGNNASLRVRGTVGSTTNASVGLS